jgi:hypothetical protein
LQRGTKGDFRIIKSLYISPVSSTGQALYEREKSTKSLNIKFVYLTSPPVSPSPSKERGKKIEQVACAPLGHPVALM